MESYRALLSALNEKVTCIHSCDHSEISKLRVNYFTPCFSGTTPPYLDTVDGKLVLTSYEVIFTPAHLPGKPESSLWKQDIRKIFDKAYEDLVQYEYEYYSCFVGCFLPRDIEVENCYGDRCRKDIHVYNSGIWCESCHGEFQDSVDFKLSYLLNSKVYFRLFPPQCIISIEKKSKPIPEGFAMQKYLDKLEKKSLVSQEIKKRLATWEEDTKLLLQKREEEKQALLVHKDYRQVLEEVNKVLQVEKEKKQAEEKAEKIKLLEEETRKKKEELDKQLEELACLKQ